MSDSDPQVDDSSRDEFAVEEHEYEPYVEALENDDQSEFRRLLKTSVNFCPTMFLRCARKKSTVRETSSIWEEDVFPRVPIVEIPNFIRFAVRWDLSIWIQKACEYFGVMSHVRTDFYPIHWAAKHNSFKCMAFWLKQYEIDLNAVDGKGMPALFVAFWWQSEECAKLLLQAGACMYTIASISPMIAALCRKSMPEKNGLFLQLLLDNDIDVNFEYPTDDESSQVETALCIAIRYNNVAAAKILIDRGANVNYGLSDDPDEFSVVTFALNNPSSECLDMLLRRGANIPGMAVRRVCQKGFHNHLRCLLLHGADANADVQLIFDMHFDTFDNTECFNLLLAAGLDLSYRWTEILNAARWCFGTVYEYNQHVQALNGLSHNHQSVTELIQMVAFAGEHMATRLYKEMPPTFSAYFFRYYNDKDFKRALIGKVEMSGFRAIRTRMTDVCIALQAIELPALLTTLILEEDCEPFARQLPFHYLWDVAVRVKHYKQTQ